MKFARIGPLGKETPAVHADGEWHSLESLAGDIDATFWETDGPTRAAKALAPGVLPRLEADGARFGAPIARPSSVVCVGTNYAAHAAESGSAPPEVPIIFHKAPNTVVGPDDAVAIPPGSTKTDWEVELGVVIGKKASYLRSPDHIAGFVTVNDLSEREYQL